MLPGFCISFPVFAFGLAVLNVAGCQTVFWLAASINSGDRWKTRVGLGLPGITRTFFGLLEIKGTLAKNDAFVRFCLSRIFGRFPPVLNH